MVGRTEIEATATEVFGSPGDQRPKNSHNRMITGIGTPSSQSRTPRPMSASMIPYAWRTRKVMIGSSTRSRKPLTNVRAPALFSRNNPNGFSVGLATNPIGTAIPSPDVSCVGRSRRFDALPATSGLPRTTDVIRPAGLVQLVPHLRTHAPHKKPVNGLITSSARASPVHSGNPAFRRPSMISFASDC
jgi:hypothetical protein